MRKIVNPTDEVRLNAIVEEDGIGFLPAKVAGPLLVGFNGRFVTVEEGSDQLEYKKIGSNDDWGESENNYEGKMHQKIKKSGFRVLLASAVLIFATLAMMLVCTTLPNGKILVNVCAKCLYLLMFVLVLPQAVAILLGRVFRKKDIISFSKYLGAQNAVENAFYDLGRAPSREEVEKYSIFAAENKYTKSSYIAVLWLVISCVSTFFDGWAYWVVTTCAVLILCLLEGNNKLAFIQAMVVSKPDEIHYKVAIAAMEKAANVLEHVEVRFVAPDPENFDDEKCSMKDCPAYDFCKMESQRMKKKDKDNNKAK